MKSMCVICGNDLKPQVLTLSFKAFKVFYYCVNKKCDRYGLLSIVAAETEEEMLPKTTFEKCRFVAGSTVPADTIDIRKQKNKKGGE